MAEADDGDGLSGGRTAVAWRAAASALLAASCWLPTVSGPARAGPERPTVDKVKPGITVLLEKRIGLIQHRRIALDHESGRPGRKGKVGHRPPARRSRARRRRASQLVALFAPEHGIRGTEDHANVANEVDAKSGLVVHSLYGSQTIAPPDSLLAGIETIIVDLPDVGTRTWTFTGVMLYSHARRRAQPHSDPRARPAESHHGHAHRRPAARFGAREPERSCAREAREGLRVISRPAAPRNDDGRDGAHVQRPAEDRRRPHRRADGGVARAPRGTTRRGSNGCGRRRTCRR